MLTDQEVALVQADTAPLNGRTLYWVLSRKQIEFILNDVNPLPSMGGAAAVDRIPYQDEALPALNLESHFGLESAAKTRAVKYLVTKVATRDGDLVKITIPFHHTVRMRPLTFSTSLAMRSGLNRNSQDTLGAFLDEEDGLFIVPDLAAILTKVDR